jgi:hypothetical protein
MPVIAMIRVAAATGRMPICLLINCHEAKAYVTILQAWDDDAVRQKEKQSNSTSLKISILGVPSILSLSYLVSYIYSSKLL